MIIKTDIDSFEEYLKDSSNFRGMAQAVHCLDNEQEVIDFVEECSANSTPITISAARTGLAGAAVPLEGKVLSVERLNRILEVNPTENYAVLEPGVRLDEFWEALDSYDLFYPPNPTEKDSMLGGNIANNSSGSRTFRYGSTRNYVESLRVVLADGEVLDFKRGEYIADAANNINFESVSGKKYCVHIGDVKMPNVKHAAGYFLKSGMDLIDLFVGSEGTLGVITQAKLRVHQKPENVFGAIVFFKNYSELFHFVDIARFAAYSKFNKAKLSPNFSTTPELYNSIDNTLLEPRLIELFDEQSLRLIREDFPQLPMEASGAIWIEQEYKPEDEDLMLSQWMELIQKTTSLADDTWVAMNAKEHEQFRVFRHAVPSRVYEINSERNQKKIGTDIAVPDKYCYEFFLYSLDLIKKSGMEYAIWGHIGNSHLHANVFPINDEDAIKGKQLYSQCLTESIRLGGTVSAEHGIGKLKKQYLLELFGEKGIELMRNIKQTLDPQCIFGRGNLFD